MVLMMMTIRSVGGKRNQKMIHTFSCVEFPQTNAKTIHVGLFGGTSTEQDFRGHIEGRATQLICSFSSFDLRQAWKQKRERGRSANFMLFL